MCLFYCLTYIKAISRYYAPLAIFQGFNMKFIKPIADECEFFKLKYYESAVGLEKVN